MNITTCLPLRSARLCYPAVPEASGTQTGFTSITESLEVQCHHWGFRLVKLSLGALTE